MLETIVRLASTSSSTATPPARSSTTRQPDGAGRGDAARGGEQNRLQLILALGGGILLGVGMLSALLASCS
jgi:hypothetical protein